MTLGHSYIYFNIYHVYLLCKCIICLHMTIGKWCFWKACTKHVTTHDIHDDHPLPAMVHIGHGSNIVHWRGNFCIGAQYPYVPNPKSQTPQLDCYYYYLLVEVNTFPSPYSKPNHSGLMPNPKFTSIHFIHIVFIFPTIGFHYSRRSFWTPGVPECNHSPAQTTFSSNFRGPLNATISGPIFYN